MKQLSKEAIESKVKEIWGSAETVKAKLVEPNHVRVHVSSSYCAPGVTFSQLMQLSEAFGTKQIDAGDTFANGGCETCDYGSEYGFMLDIKPEAKG